MWQSCLLDFSHLEPWRGIKLTGIQQVSKHVPCRAGRVPGGTIVLSRERTELSRTIPSFQKYERSERVLKNLERLVKERNGMGIAWKERLKSLTRSYYQELVLSWEGILNQECVLNHLEIVKDFWSYFFFYFLTNSFV